VTRAVGPGVCRTLGVCTRGLYCHICPLVVCAVKPINRYVPMVLCVLVSCNQFFGCTEQKARGTFSVKQGCIRESPPSTSQCNRPKAQHRCNSTSQYSSIPIIQENGYLCVDSCWPSISQGTPHKPINLSANCSWLFFLMSGSRRGCKKLPTGALATGIT